MSQIILNVAVGEPYVSLQLRLSSRLAELAPETLLWFWRDSWPGRPHVEAPYGFKIDAFDVAEGAGYTKALWLDSAVFPVKNLEPVWKYLDETPVLLLGDGWNVGQWTSDAALAIYGADRDAAMLMQLCYACVVGINFDMVQGLEFLWRWRGLRNRGAFVGAWRNDQGEVSSDPRCLGHRHDQSAASWLAHDMAIPMAHMPTFLSMHATDGDPVFRTGQPL